MDRPQRTEALRFRVTPEEREFLEAEAVRQDRSVSAVIRLALKEYAEKRDKVAA